MTTSKENLQAVIDKIGLTVHSEFVPFSRSRNKDNLVPSLNWRVTILLDGRAVLATDYSAGGGYCPANKITDKHVRKTAVAHECEMGHNYYCSGLPILPDSTDVIYSVARDSEVLNYSCFEDWASDFGYDPDSRSAEKIYRECLNVAVQLRTAIRPDALGELVTALEDY